jgi:hypothetical protein
LRDHANGVILLAAASPPVSKAILLRFARQRLRLRGTISARICCLRPLTAISLTPRSASACCNPHSCGAAVPCGLVQHVFSPPARIKSSHATALSWPRRCAKNALHYGRRPLPAATGIAQSVRARRLADGSPTAKPSSCRFRIFTSSTRCRANCVTSPTRTSAWSTTC